MMQFDSILCILTRSDAIRHIWCNLTLFDSIWCNLLQSDSLWFKLMQFDTIWLNLIWLKTVENNSSINLAIIGKKDDKTKQQQQQFQKLKALVTLKANSRLKRDSRLELVEIDRVDEKYEVVENISKTRPEYERLPPVGVRPGTGKESVDDGRDGL